jgi:hypothetical protein
MNFEVTEKAKAIRERLLAFIQAKIDIAIASVIT